MSEQQEISQLVTAVFRAWRAAGIDFLVLRNYDQLPDFTSNDIDVLVRPEDLERAESTLRSAAGQSGFQLHNRARFATLALYLASRNSNAQTHFDLFTALKWRGFDFLQCDGFLGRRVDRGLFAIPHPADEAATNLLASMIFSGRVKEKYKASITAGFRAHPAAVTELLAKSYGQAQARFLAEAGAAGRWGEIETRTRALRRTLVCRQMTRQPWATAKSQLADAARLTGRWLRPPGLIVVLCGADGCGKSTAANNLVDGLASTFSLPKGRHFHWKPPLLSTRTRAARGPATDPHGRPPRNPVVSLAYFAVHCVEFCLGSHVSLRPITFRGGLVLIDRYYHDFFVDQRRYRMRVPQWVVRGGRRLVKAPDLVLLFDAPPQVLQRRKQEVPFAETERQCKAYLNMVRALPQGRVINADQPPEKVTADSIRVILDFMAERTARRWR
jgi:thymidylate kinase